MNQMEHNIRIHLLYAMLIVLVLTGLICIHGLKMNRNKVDRFLDGFLLVTTLVGIFVVVINL